MSDSKLTGVEMWELMLMSANRSHSEYLYKQALSRAELECGCDSLQAGLVLLDLSDYYQAAGNNDEAATCEERANRILQHYAQENPQWRSQQEPATPLHPTAA